MSELLTEREGDVLILTLNRASACNAVTESQALALQAQVEGAAGDLSLRGLVLTASGSDYFAAGGDLRELATYPRDREGAARVLAMGEALAALRRADVPVVAAVQGAALGGGAELVLLADHVLLEEHASLSFRQARMGLSTAWGGLARLLDRVGPAVAHELLWSCRTVSAPEALALGLADAIVPRGEARSHALQRLHTWALQPREALALTKRALRQSLDARHAGTREAEREAFTALWGGPAHVTALEAFLTKPSASKPHAR